MPPISRTFVHMDSMFGPLAQKLLVACLDILETWRGDQLKDFDFLFIDVPYLEAKNLGVNLVALGNDKVLSTVGAGTLN